MDDLYDAVDNAIMYPADLERMEREEAHTFFPTNFKFLKGHNGIRPGYFHLLLGTTGSGKSTLMRALVLEAAKTAKVLVWLTEEKKDAFKKGLGQRTLDKDVGKNIFIISDKDIGPDEINITSSFSAYKKRFEEKVLMVNPSIVFFDNLTSCPPYEADQCRNQLPFSQWFKSFFSSRGMAVFMIAHTGKTVSDNQDRLFEANDIRGTAHIVNIAEYLYTYQRMSVKDKFVPFVRVLKSREYNHSGIFMLNYEDSSRKYVNDYKTKFDNFKETFKKRDK